MLYIYCVSVTVAHLCVYVCVIGKPLLKPGDGPIVLVVSPTRELALQTLVCTALPYVCLFVLSCFISHTVHVMLLHFVFFAIYVCMYVCVCVRAQEECHKFGHSSRLKYTCVYGGVPRGPQARDLQRGLDVVCLSYVFVCVCVCVVCGVFVHEN